MKGQRKEKKSECVHVQRERRFRYKRAIRLCECVFAAEAQYLND
jgi:hypothetical protein